MDDDGDTDGAQTGTTAATGGASSVAVERQPLIDGDENECTMLLGPAKQPLYKGNSGPFSSVFFFFHLVFVFVFFVVVIIICLAFFMCCKILHSWGSVLLSKSLLDSV